jgi:hypothetical protein
MTWQRRLIELACAGGTLTGCSSTPNPIPCGNVNADPCICDRMPEDSPQCVAEATCRGQGHEWVFDIGQPAADGGTQLFGHCDTGATDAATHD